MKTLQQELIEALRDLATRCDGEEGIRADGSNIETAWASAVLARAEREAEMAYGYRIESGRMPDEWTLAFVDLDGRKRLIRDFVLPERPGLDHPHVVHAIIYDGRSGGPRS